MALVILPASAFDAEDLSNADLHDQDLRGRTFVGANLENANLARAVADGVDFTGAVLRGADCTGAYFNKANLSGVDLRAATLASTAFRGTNFSGANLTGLNLSKYVVIQDCNFKGANLTRTKGWTDLTGCDFSDANLAGAYLLEAKVWGTAPIFRGAKYDRATRFHSDFDPVAAGCVQVDADQPIVGENLSGQKLDNSDMRGRNLERANISDSDLTGSDLTNILGRQANFQRTDLSGVRLDAADLREADLRGARFDVTMLRGTKFEKADLEGLDFTKAVTRDCDFRGANLKRAKGLQDITGCNFGGADLRGAIMLDARDWNEGSAKFVGAKYDRATRFPKGINPDDVGAVFEEEAAVAPAVVPAAAAPETPRPNVPAAPANVPFTGSTPIRIGGGGVPATVPTAQTTAAAAPAGFDETLVGKGRDLSGQDLRGRDLRAEALAGANMKGCILISTDLRENNLQLANLNGADLFNAHLEGADLRGADFRDAKFERAWLSGADLSRASLAGQDLSALMSTDKIKFRGADLRGLKKLPVVFTNWDFRGADLRGAQLAGPTFDSFRSSMFAGAIYDKDTRWPKGFDLEGAQVVLAGPAPGNAGDGWGWGQLTAGKRDPEAPVEAEVKRLFQEKYTSLRAGLFTKMVAMKGEVRIPAPLGIRDHFEFVKIEYREKRSELADTGLATTFYPVRVVCDLTSEGANGTETTSKIDWVIDFWHRPGQQSWECLLSSALYLEEVAKPKD